MDALPSESRAIGDHEYTVVMLPYSKWKRLKLVLFKAVGPSLSRGLEKLNEGGPTFSGIPSSAIGAILAGLAESLDEKAYDAIISELGSHTKVSGEPGFLTAQKQELFWAQQNYKELAGWIAFALEVQFRDFFGDLASLIPKGPPEGPKKNSSPSRSISTGISGGSSAADGGL